MTKEEIRKAIDENNAKITSEMEHIDFTLNDKINDLLKINSELRTQCEHEFVDGVCIWCDEFEVRE